MTDRRTMLDEEIPGIIGRERALIDGVTKLMLDAARKRHDYTPARETRRGSSFDLSLMDPGGNPTGHVARVTVEAVFHATKADDVPVFEPPLLWG